MTGIFRTSHRIDSRIFTFLHKKKRYYAIKIGAGKNKPERIIPPAGEEHAYDRDNWSHTVEVYVSETGRSVRVFIDGEEIPLSRK